MSCAYCGHAEIGYVNNAFHCIKKENYYGIAEIANFLIFGEFSKLFMHFANDHMRTNAYVYIKTYILTYIVNMLISRNAQKCISYCCFCIFVLIKLFLYAAATPTCCISNADSN